jgi:hypothetical protein
MTQSVRKMIRSPMPKARKESKPPFCSLPIA